jgi:hypothetical protein
MATDFRDAPNGRACIQQKWFQGAIVKKNL